MSPRPDVSEERTGQILAAAAEVFARKGFHRARMDDIAQEAGLSKGTLYLYFRNKEAMITALLDRIFRREMHGLDDLIHADGPASERLLRFVDAILADLPRWLRLLPVAYEFLSLIFRRRAVQRAFRQYLRTYLDLTIPIIQDGIDRGEFHNLDPTDGALALGAIFEGTILLWVYDPETVDVEKHIRTGVQLLLEGMRRG